MNYTPLRGFPPGMMGYSPARNWRFYWQMIITASGSSQYFVLPG
jgi:hypothetical protein